MVFMTSPKGVVSVDPDNSSGNNNQHDTTNKNKYNSTTKGLIDRIASSLHLPKSPKNNNNDKMELIDITNELTDKSSSSSTSSNRGNQINNRGNNNTTNDNNINTINNNTSNINSNSNNSEERNNFISSLLWICVMIPKRMMRMIWTSLWFIPNLFLNILSSLFCLNNYNSINNQKEKEKEERIKEIYKKMKQDTNTYQEWLECAKQLDVLEDREKWRRVDESPYYDSKLIRHRLGNLKMLAEKGDIAALAMSLRAGLLRNLGGMGNGTLFQESHVGTKYVIDDYIQEVVTQLRNICYNVSETEMSIEKKFDFFYETRQSFGRSALLLSGGATLGMHHLGVIKALRDNHLLPRIISGSSVGSIIASFVGVSTDDELDEVFKSHGWNLDAFESGPSFNRKLARLLKKGVLMDIKKLQRCVRSNVGDLTFKEAYDKTGRVLNITVASTTSFEFPRLLNYLTAPNVLVWSAAAASCALKFLFEPVELVCKDNHNRIIPYHPSGQKFSDGSVEADLPMERLSELFNVNHFIVSQVNPHVIPFISDRATQYPNGIIEALKFISKSEIKHRVIQLASLGLIPSSISGIPPLITQKYEGDVTLVPDVNLKDYTTIISNPSAEMIGQCIKKGMSSTFPKMAILKNHCLIELTLDSIVTHLRARMYQNEGIQRHRYQSDDIITYSPCIISNPSVV